MLHLLVIQPRSCLVENSIGGAEDGVVQSYLKESITHSLHPLDLRGVQVERNFDLLRRGHLNKRHNHLGAPV